MKNANKKLQLLPRRQWDIPVVDIKQEKEKADILGWAVSFICTLVIFGVLYYGGN